MSIALKFTSLFIRTLAKPIANTIKSHARDHPTFRRRCIRAAQAIHRTDAHLRQRLLNENNRKVKPLNDARAIETGATFVAESFVFSVAASLIFYESWRSKRKQQKQQESVADDIRLLQDEISWIKGKMEETTIIKPGEAIPVPSGLKPAILKIISEQKDLGSPQAESPISSSEQQCQTKDAGGQLSAEPKSSESKPEDSSEN